MEAKKKEKEKKINKNIVKEEFNFLYFVFYELALRGVTICVCLYLFYFLNIFFMIKLQGLKKNLIF